MKKYILILLAVGCFSCENFLDEEQVSNISYEFYNTEKGIEALVWAAYEPLRFWSGEPGIRLSNLGTDIGTYTRVSSGNEFHLYTADINSTNGNFSSLWNNYYKGINSANIAINRLPNVTATGALRTAEAKVKRQAEVRFLRGYYYFMLVQTFGKIPLLLEENLVVKDDFERAAVADVYKAIITDLTYAATNLPETQADYARPTRAAAQHLLADVYLTRGSAVQDQRGQKPTDMDSAAFYAEKVIAFKGGLTPDFHDAHRFDNEKNKDVLFAIQYTPNTIANGGGNSSHLYYVAQYDNIPGGGMDRDILNGRAFVRLMPTEYLFNLFNRRIDSRFYKAYKTVFFSNTDNVSKIQKWTAASAPSPDLVGKPKFAKGDTSIVFTFDKGISDAEIAKKPYVFFPKNKWTDRFFPHYQYMLDPTRVGVNDTDGRLDFKLFWLAETYLIAAEAYGRKGDYAKAAEYLNVVRRRAAYKEGEKKTFHFYKTDGGSVANLRSSTEKAMEIGVEEINSPTKLLNFILDERARELGGDYERWYDLVRTETFIERVTTYNPAAKAGLKEFHKLRPIPQTHIDRLANPGPPAEEQNPGY